MHGEVEIAAEAIRAGASAYVLKNSAVETLSHAIWESLNGHTVISPRIVRSMNTVMASAKHGCMRAVELTPREREVLQLVAEGRTIRGVSAILKIASRTVVFHKSNIMDKLGRRTTADLTQYAIQNGIIDVQTSV
jgi:DNA-binding NarL/FixJ family response regulator